MMQRLIDQTSSSDPVTVRAAELLSSMPPLDTSQLRRRVLPSPVGRRAAVIGLRPGLVLAVTLGTVVAAAATMHAWPRAPDHTPGALSGPPTEAPVAPPVSPPSPARGSAFVSPPTTGVPDVSGAESAAGGSEPARSPTKAVVSNAPSTKVAPRDTSAVEDESTLIVRAVRALRRDGDPTRAEALAAQSLQRFPHGAQVEEAMDLVMESAFARGDVPEAQRAASAYLDRFRSGRFADRAQRILAPPTR
jgi:hypothetical protein